MTKKAPLLAEGADRSNWPDVAHFLNRNNTLLDKRQEGNAAAIAKSCHDKEGDTPGGGPRTRPLGGIKPGPVRDILADLSIDIAERVGKAGKRPDDAELDRQLAQLEQVSPLRRPLYIALLAEAIESGEMQPDWTAIDLTRFVLNKERARWEAALTVADIKGDAQKPWFNLYLLATMCGGLEIPEGGKGVFGDGALDDWLPTRKQHGDGTTLARFASGATGRTLPRLEPDILGEFFVLETMQGWDSRDVDFRAAAWHHDPGGFAEFLLRAVNSFPQHETLDRLLEVPSGAADLPGFDPCPLIEAWGWRAVRLREIEDTEWAGVATNAMLGLLRPFVKNNPDDAWARQWLAMGLGNAIAASQPDFAHDNSLLDELRRLAKTHDRDGSVREWLASGLNRRSPKAGRTPPVPVGCSTS